MLHRILNLVALVSIIVVTFAITTNLALQEYAEYQCLKYSQVTDANVIGLTIYCEKIHPYYGSVYSPLSEVIEYAESQK